MKKRLPHPACVAEMFYCLFTFTTAVLPWERPEETSSAERCIPLLLNLCQEKEEKEASSEGMIEKDVREM